MFSADAGDELRRTLAEKDQELVLVYEDNLVDKVWGQARPEPPSKPLRVHELRYAGVDVATKLANLRKELSSAGATAMVVTMLDEVAWLLNMVSTLVGVLNFVKKLKIVCRCVHMPTKTFYSVVGCI